MFCQKCGANIPDESAFCDKCGAQILKEEIIAEEKNVIIEESVPAEETVAEESGEISEPKKKFKFPKKLVFIGVPVIAFAVVIALNWYAIGGFFVKWFGSDKAYFEYVEKSQVESVADALSGLYGELLSFSLDEEISTQSNIKLKIGDKFFDLMGVASGGVDLNQLKSFKEIDLNICTDMAETNARYQFGVGLAGKNIVDVDFIIDSTEGDAFFGLPGLTNKYILMPGESMQGMDDVINSLEDIKKLAPEESAINNLLEKYIDIAFECITGDYVKVKDGKIKANGIEQTCTVIEVKITDKLVLEICAEVLKNVKDDEDFENVIDQIQDVVEELYSGKEMPEMNFYKEVSAGIDEAFDSIKKAIGNIKEERTLCYLIDYIDSIHNVIGRRIDLVMQSYSDVESGKETRKTVFFMGKAEKDKCGYEIWIEINGIKVALLGTGSESFGGALTGKFELVISGFDGSVKECSVLNVELKDLAISDGISGFIKLRVGKDVAHMLGDDMAKVKAVLSLLDPSVEIKLDSSSDEVNNSVKLLSGDGMLLQMEIRSKKNNTASVDVPSKKDTVKSDKVEEWLADIDINVIFDRLEDAGVSKELIEYIKNQLKG